MATGSRRLLGLLREPSRTDIFSSLSYQGLTQIYRFRSSKSRRESSNAKTEDISLPLLKSEHAEEVVGETERINELSEHLKYIIELLGVVGRFLEAMIFQMSVIGSAVANKEVTVGNTFCQSGLRYFLQECHYQPKYCQELLKRTKQHINEKTLLDHFTSKDNLEIILSLVAYTLFWWPVDRTDTISIIKKRKIEGLEKEELIFLDGNENKRLKLPFLTLHENYSHRNLDALPPIRVIEFLDNVILLDQNKRLTISVLVFRLWVIYQRSIAKGAIDTCKCMLSQLVPLRLGQKDMSLKLLPVFTIRSTECRSTKTIERNLLVRLNRHRNAYHNLQKRPFVDSFLLTEPIFIQNKQQVVSRKKVIAGHSS
ncbi:3502_t:CDS:2 [Ambispora gerdemannii]|uniref:3502_t:CDS:1 n=1 Tax=Ambispora gerdemannii TaxID=144530 RepID=A0A9N9EZL2_9GLOM|nr:3502_t:CDS:2 [Ambispora gerdemannii]